jgi:hypothetical protein
MQKKFLFSAFAVAMFAIPACGGSTGGDGGGPDILSADATSVDNGDGTFDITLSIDFDDDVDVVSYTVDCTDGDDPSNDIDEAHDLDEPHAAGTFDLDLDGVPATPFDYTCTVQLVDEDGDASLPVDFTLDLS